MSRRSRANRSIGTKINNIDSRLSSEEKAVYVPLSANTISNLQLSANSINEESLSGNAVTDEAINSGSVVTPNLGAVTQIASPYHLDLMLGDGGNLRLDGDQYPHPNAGSQVPLALDENGKVVVGNGVWSGDGGPGTLDWSAITGKPTTFPTIWSSITGIPATFAPAPHQHPVADISGLSSVLSLKSDVGHKHPVSDLTGATATGQVPTYNGTTVVWQVPTGGGGTGGTVAAATTTTAGIVELATVAETLTGTDAVRAVTPAGVFAVGATKAGINQAFVAIDTDGVPYFDPGMDFTNAVPLYPDTDGVPYVNSAIPWNPGTGGGGGTGGTISWNSITNIPPTFTPSAHTHVPADITGGTNGYVLTSNGTVGTWAPAPAGGGTGGTVSPASDTTPGIVELATNAETIAGADIVRAVTPAADKAALDARFSSYTPTWANVSGKPVYTWDPSPDNAGGIYRRLFTINGGNASAGAYVTFIVSGMGDFGTARKATVVGHFGQRGENSVALRLWGFDIGDVGGRDFYTKKVTSDPNNLTYELWFKSATWTFGHQVTVLSQSHTNSQVVANMDYDSNVNPGGLVGPYDIADIDDIFEGRLGLSMPNINGINWDDITQRRGGWYAGYNSANSPLGDNAGYMTQVVATDVDNLVQIAHRTTPGNLRSFKRERVAGTWQRWRGLDQNVLNVMDFGAKGDAVYLSTATGVAAGNTTINFSSASFTSADVGKVALIGGTVTTITAVNSATSVTIGAPVVSTDLSWTSSDNYSYTDTNGQSLGYFLYGTDDTVAIQKALDAADGGGVVMFPGQTEYIITAELHIKKRTIVRAGRSVIRKVGWTSGILDNNSDNSGAGYNANSNIIIEGGVWESMGHHADRGINGMTFAHGHDITVRDAIFKNFAGSHAIELDGTKSVKILNCGFLGYRAIRIVQSGSSTRDRQYAEAIQIDYGSTNSNDNMPCTDILVEGCHFADSDEMPGMYWGKAMGSHTVYGTVSPAAPKFHEYIKFVHNTVYGNRWNGIRALQWKNTLIGYNFFMNGGRNYLDSNRQSNMTSETILVDVDYGVGTTNGAGTGSSTSGIVIIGNIIRDGYGTGSTAAGISVHGDTTINVSGIVVANNLIMNPAGNAVYTSYVNNADISGNKGVSTGASAFYHDHGNYISVKNNVAVDVAGNGVWFNAVVEGSVVGNQITSPSSNGVIIAGGSTDCLIATNLVHGAASGAASGSSTSAYQISGSSHYCSVMNNVARPGGTGYVAPANGRGGLYITTTCTGVSHFGNDVRTLGVSTNTGSEFVPSTTTPNRA